MLYNLYLYISVYVHKMKFHKHGCCVRQNEIDATEMIISAEM